jgi:hypothetical protein
MGLGTIFMVGLILGVLSASQVVSREIEVKTAGTVISKPVSRFVLLLGKFLGVSGAMWVAGYLLSVVMLLTVRIGVPSDISFKLDWPAFLGEVLPAVFAIGVGLYANYFNRRNFPWTAVLMAVPSYTLAMLVLLLVGKDWDASGLQCFSQHHAWPVALAAVLVMLGVWVLSSVAVAVSTRLNVVSNIVVCGGVFFLGMVSHYMFGWAADASWGTWDVNYEGYVISGYAKGTDGEPLAGVHMSGLPGSVVTDRNGFYRVMVGKGGWGTVVPRHSAYVFRPVFLTYPVVEADTIEQNYTAVRVAKGFGYAARVAGRWAAWTAYHALPSFQSFWVADQLNRPEPYVPVGYLGRAFAYACLWCGSMVAFAAYLFEKREII